MASLYKYKVIILAEIHAYNNDKESIPFVKKIQENYNKYVVPFRPKILLHELIDPRLQFTHKEFVDAVASQMRICHYGKTGTEMFIDIPAIIDSKADVAGFDDPKEVIDVKDTSLKATLESNVRREQAMLEILQRFYKTRCKIVVNVGQDHVIYDTVLRQFVNHHDDVCVILPTGELKETLTVDVVTGGRFDINTGASHKDKLNAKNIEKRIQEDQENLEVSNEELSWRDKILMAVGGILFIAAFPAATAIAAVIAAVGLTGVWLYGAMANKENKQKIDAANRVVEKKIQKEFLDPDKATHTIDLYFRSYGDKDVKLDPINIFELIAGEDRESLGNALYHLGCENDDTVFGGQYDTYDLSKGFTSKFEDLLDLTRGEPYPIIINKDNWSITEDQVIHVAFAGTTEEFYKAVDQTAKEYENPKLKQTVKQVISKFVNDYNREIKRLLAKAKPIKASKEDVDITPYVDQLKDNEDVSLEAGAKGKRKATEDLILKYIDRIVTGKTNTELYKELFKSMSDKEFDQFMQDLRDGKRTLSIIVPNGDKRYQVDINNNIKLAKELGYDFFQRLVVGETDGLPAYTTTNKYMILKLPVRRAAQLLQKKISIPENARTINVLTGQVTGKSKGSKLTNPELQLLISLGLDKSIQELLKIRGGDQGSQRAMDNYLVNQGAATQAQINQYESGVVSKKTLKAYFTAMHIKNNL